MYKLLFINILFITFGSYSYTQTHGFCGTGAQENHLIRERMFQNRENKSLNSTRSGAIKYVPINYFLTAKNDGTGRLRYIKVLENICDINRIYADQEISFYIRSINDVNNTFIYDDPSSTFGFAALNNIEKNYNNGINLFVASKANGSSQGVLAFYNPTGDYLVSESAQVGGKGYVLAHEIGHFLSLAHTFYGWESTTYDCSQACPTEVFIGGVSVKVEYFDRELTVNGKKHCLISADGFCDTQADYNCGFGFNGCVWSGCMVDPDGKGLNPDEKNIMSYFLNNCHEFFSEEQKAAMARDYASSARSYLRATAHTPLPPVENAPGNPTALINGFNSVNIKWDAVPNATHYILEYAPVSLSTPQFKNHILQRTDTTFTNLTKGTKYAWRVTAYNATNPCPKSTAILSFTNSNFGVGTNDTELELSDVSIQYSGLNQYTINLFANKSELLQFNLYSVDGKLLSSENLNIQAGANSIRKYVDGTGLFLFQLSNSQRSISGKFFAY
ncbi:MAG: hypothetical protein HOP11_12815 [Saprospiraceae bacterium]|nr:hypothetical protein [Saprospiraceae bacterium]